MTNEMYTTLATWMADRSEEAPFNLYQERPALLSLLPDVSDKDVLDVGRGSWVYAAELHTRGAGVVALDVDNDISGQARKKLDSSVLVVRADLTKPLNMFRAAAFDLLLSSMTLDYYQGWDGIFTEFHRILRPGGWLIFSVAHPFAEYRYHSFGSYFNTEPVSCEINLNTHTVEMNYYRRPLIDILHSLSDTGFTLNQLYEPQPDPRLQTVDPELYVKLTMTPSVLCVKARKALY